MKSLWITLFISAFLIWPNSLTMAWEQNKEEPPILKSTEKKARYHIEVLVNAYLDEMVPPGKTAIAKNKIPDKSLVGINFYEGVKIAVKRMQKKDYKVDIYVRDVNSKEESIDALIKKGTLEKADLIIGALQGNELEKVISFAKKEDINFISALSPSDASTTKNPYLTILQPSLEAHVNKITETALSRYKGAVIPVLRRNTVNLDQMAFEYVMNNVEAHRLLPKVVDVDDSTIEAYALLFDSNKVNPVIIPIMEAKYAGEVIDWLLKRFPSYEFEVFGMPTWRVLNQYKKRGSSNLALVYTSAYYFDPAVGVAKFFHEDYKNVFGSKPNDMAYVAYECVNWFVYLLDKYGTVFNTSYADNANAVFTKYNIQPIYTKDDMFLYWRNQNLNVLTYREGNLQVD